MIATDVAASAPTNRSGAKRTPCLWKDIPTTKNGRYWTTGKLANCVEPISSPLKTSIAWSRPPTAAPPDPCRSARLRGTILGCRYDARMKAGPRGVAVGASPLGWRVCPCVGVPFGPAGRPWRAGCVRGSLVESRSGSTRERESVRRRPSRRADDRDPGSTGRSRVVTERFTPGVGAVFSADIAVPEHEREVRFYARVLGTGDPRCGGRI